jgi:MFS superfamily sulfate permease-like transporter
VVFRYDAELFYANANRFADNVAGLMLAAPHPVRWLVLDCSGIPDVDYSAGSALKTLIAFVHHRGAILGLAAVDPDLKQTLTQLGVLAQVRPEHLFPTVTQAVAAFRQVPVEQAFVPVPSGATPAGDGDATMPPAAAAAPSSDPVVVPEVSQ